MVPFEMPLDARLALAKMSVIYEREVGAKIRMSRDEDIVSLINFAVDSFNEEIIKYLDTFVKLLAPNEVRQLAAQGANIYRGAVVREDEVESPVGHGDAGVKMYRGVPVETAEPARPVAEEVKKKVSAPTKGKRVYRGRVIED